MFKHNTKTGLVGLGLLLLLTINSFTTTSAIWPFKKYATVQVNNWLASKGSLLVHCKDQNQDLGLKRLPFLEWFSFKFELASSWWGTKLYYCGFTFDNTLHWFDIYDQWRDEEVCQKVCNWVIVESGPCLHNPSPDLASNKCYHWNHKTPIRRPLVSFPLPGIVNQTTQEVGKHGQLGLLP